MEIFSEQPYIFNLGHGVLPETKPETIKFIIDIIRLNMDNDHPKIEYGK